MQQLEKTLRDDAIVKSSTEDGPKLPKNRILLFDCSAEDWWDSPVQGRNLTVELFNILGKAMIFWIKTVVGPETEYAVEILKPDHVDISTQQNKQSN